MVVAIALLMVQPDLVVREVAALTLVVLIKVLLAQVLLVREMLAANRL